MGNCEKLKWNRRKLGMNQEELAKKLGVSQATISKLESDETAWATMRDSTTDAVYDKLSELATWSCNINSVLKDDIKEIDIREMRKKVRDKRNVLGMSQRDLGAMLGLNQATICNYEKHDKYWKQSNTMVVDKLVGFVGGKYDLKTDSVKEEPKMDENSTIIASNESSVLIHDATAKPSMLLTKKSIESVEDALNECIDILQDRMQKAIESGKSPTVYVRMVSGLCNGYLKELD